LLEIHSFWHGQPVKLLQQWCSVVVSTDAVENGLQTAFTLKAMRYRQYMGSLGSLCGERISDTSLKSSEKY